MRTSVRPCEWEHRPAYGLPVGANAKLKPARLTVDPGGETGCEITVRNTGRIVDEFTFQVLGDTAPWSSVEPASISLMPDTEGTVQLKVRPPRSSDVREAALPFAVRVVSKEDPKHSVVEEGLVQIGRFVDSFAELVPRTSRGRLRARHELAVDNRGNSRISATLAATDPDEQLSFRIGPPSVVADPGTAAFSKVTVRPRKPFFWGAAKTFPFRVLANADGAEPLAADGSIVQEAIVPKWAPLALLAAIGLLALWMFALKPSIEAGATEQATKDAVKALAPALNQLDNRVKGLEGDPAASEPLPLPAGDGGGAGGIVSLSEPFSHRLAVTADPGGSKDDKLAVSDDETLSVTDILLQNPRGNSGTLQLRRGDQVLLDVSLDNFRDLDYHFVSPLVFNGRSEVVLFVVCAARQPQADLKCTPSVSLSGTLQG